MKSADHPASHLVIGTAGHVDHGKTVLVRALTGTDTDRLPEEKERGISIDLGFARMDLPSGRSASIVDVPGHERFIKNMVAGATGFDLVLLVVAADEGVMPQTREHLDIIDLLGVRRGVVALTKSDLVEDEWLELVTEDLRAVLQGGALASAPLVAVSAHTGQGLSDLLEAIDQELARVEREITGLPRLPIDRVFTVAGFGTVVTGTLTGGTIRRDDRLVLLPEGRPTRIRSIQVHGRQISQAEPGQRVALNVGDLSTSQIARGNVLAPPGAIHPVRTLAVCLRLLPGAPEIRDNDRVHFHVGTQDTVGRLTLLNRSILSPGESAYARVRLDHPASAALGDRFIMRRFSPVFTIGGGEILDVHGYRYRKGRAAALEHLEERHRLDGEELLCAVAEQVPRRRWPVTLVALARDLGWAVEKVFQSAAGLERAGRLAILAPGRTDACLLTADQLDTVRQVVVREIRGYLESRPLEQGMPREMLRAKTLPGCETHPFSTLMDLLASRGDVEVTGSLVGLPGRQVRLSDRQACLARQLRDLAATRGYSPPSIEEAAQMMGVSTGDISTLVRFLSAKGELYAAGEYVLDGGLWDDLLSRLRVWFAEHQTLTVAQLRDLLGTTRKYAVPLAERLDMEKVTLRREDLRYQGPALKGPAR